MTIHMEELYSKVHLNFGQKILKIFKGTPKSFQPQSQYVLTCSSRKMVSKNLKQNNTNKKFVYLISPNKIKIKFLSLN